MNRPSISVVVNTCNRATTLRSALHGLHYDDFEVVVVNRPSVDATEAVLAEWAPRLKLRHCPEENLSVSRTIGIAAAAGEIVAFIDDDAVPHPDWLDRLVTQYQDPSVGAVGGFTVDHTGTRWQARETICDRFGNAHPVSDFFDERPLDRPGSPFYPSLLGTNSSFRMAAPRQVGGFDHAFAYLLDETDLCLRIVDAGWQVRYEPTALARRTGPRARADLEPDVAPAPFLRSAPADGLRICMVSQGFPPENDAGIARWTGMVARELARRGHMLHIITRAADEEGVTQQDGLRLHALRPDADGAEGPGARPRPAAGHRRLEQPGSEGGGGAEEFRP